MKLSTKIFLLGTVIILCFALSFIAVSFRFKRNMLDYGCLNVKNVVEVAYTVMSEYDAMAKCWQKWRNRLQENDRSRRLTDLPLTSYVVRLAPPTNPQRPN